jgi:hypothetical protein
VSSERERALHRRRSEILERMRSNRQSAALLESLRTPQAPPVPPEQSFLRETVRTSSLSGSADSALLTTPGETPAMAIARSASAPTQRALTVGFAGRLVRADEANLNGAFFSRSDLDFGLSSLAMAPVTYNHVGDGAVGWIENASISETPEHGYHTSINGRLWVGRFPFVYESFESSLASAQAALSMECMAAAVGCMTEGCMAVASGADDACEHIMERTGPRRMMYPTFYGAAVILDGVKPGWPGASLTKD